VGWDGYAVGPGEKNYPPEPIPPDPAEFAANWDAWTDLYRYELGPSLSGRDEG
jgi:hypothetical protein